MYKNTYKNGKQDLVFEAEKCFEKLLRLTTLLRFLKILDFASYVATFIRNVRLVLMILHITTEENMKSFLIK